MSVRVPTRKVALTRGTPRGVRCCPQAPISWEEHYDKQVEGDGRAIYWLSGRLPDHAGGPESDVAVLRDGYVAVTPLRPDLTDGALLDQINGWAWPQSFA